MAQGRNKRKNKRTPAPPTRTKLWLFRILAILIVPTAVLLTEIALRLAHYGNPTTATVADSIKDKDVYRNNPRFSWQFFPPEIAREATPYTFAAEKPENTCRIFILGASAAQGTPDPSFSFARILEIMLRDRYPGVNFEVINTAMVAINSHVVRKIARDCARRQPDIFVVYLGNNEVVGPFGAGTVFTPLSENINLIHLGIALKATRLGQLITNTLETDTPKTWTGMEMFLEMQVRPSDPALRTVYKHFRTNIEDIRDIALESNAKIIFSTVPTNLKDSPPFASLPKRNLTKTEALKWQQHYDHALAFELDSKYDEAIEQYLIAHDITTDADLHYRLATCYSRLVQFDKARQNYIYARHYDTLRFRADSNINAIIRKVATEKSTNKVLLADSESALAEKSPNRITGAEFFHEHVHLNFTGNYHVARTILTQVENALPAQIKKHKTTDKPIPDEQTCKTKLAYTTWDQYKNTKTVLNDFLRKPPFTNQLHHDRRIREMESKLAALKAELTPRTLKYIDTQYRTAIARTPDDWLIRWRYAEFLSDRMHDEKSAAEQYRIVTEQLPHYAQAHAKLAMSSAALGDLDTAIALNLKAIQINPAHIFARYNLAFAYHSKGDLEKALTHYDLTIEYKPDHPQAWNNIGVILLAQNKTQDAIAHYRKALQHVKGSADLHYNLGVILKQQQKFPEAIEQFKKALDIQPNSRKIQNALNDTLLNH